jgi:hypothetical protein
MTQQLTNELMSDASGFMSTSTSAMGVIENNQSENLLAKDNDAKEMVEPHVIAQGQKLFHFDDISNTKNYAKFGGAKLGDFDWSDNWYVKHKYGSSGTGYEKGNVSPYHSGFNGSAEPVSVTSDEEFTLDSVYLTAAWNKGLNITIEGLNDGKQKFLETVTVNNDKPNKFDFNTPYIDEIKFKSFGGNDADPGDGGAGAHFVIDNLYYQLKDDKEIVIDFESLKHDDDLVKSHGFFYEEDGFVLENLSTNPFATFGTEESRFSGSTALFNNTVDGVTILSAENNKSFDLDSIDLTELNGPNVAKVTFKGELEKGGSVQQTFTLDGKSFEPQTFTFSDDFDEVVSVEWTQVSPFHQFDNITIKQGSEDDPLEIIEDNGNASFAKHKEDGSYWAINNKTQEKLQLKNKKNELITDEDSDEWDGVAVELKTKKGKDSYKLLLDGDGENEDNAGVWKANDEGVIKKQKLKWITKKGKIFKLENKFEYDINGDDIIGKPPKKKDYLDDDDKIDGSSGGSRTEIGGLDDNGNYLMASSDIITKDSFTSPEDSMVVIKDLDNNNDYPMASSGISTIELFPNVDVGGASISDSSIYTVDGASDSFNYV